MQWGIDLGGTKIECTVLKDGKPIVRRRLPTESDRGYHHIIAQIERIIAQTATEIGAQPAKIGIATPGVLDPETARMKNCNTVSMNGQPMQKDLENVLQIPVTLANDANCFALAESLLGAGRAFGAAELVFGIIMGTGVGGGLVVHGKIIHGLHGIAGEWGHNILEENGTPCYCGKRGCVETVISGVALENFYFEKSGHALKLAEIVKKSAGADAAAKLTVERLLENYGRAVATLINVLDPNLIVVGGGVGNVDLLYSEGFERIRKYVLNDGVVKTRIVKPLLGDSAGVFGAALL